MEGCRRDANVLIILDPTPPSAQPFCERSCVVHTDVRSPPPPSPLPFESYGRSECFGIIYSVLK